MAFRERRNSAVMRNDSTGQFRGSVGRSRKPATGRFVSPFHVDSHTVAENIEAVERFLADERMGRPGREGEEK